ncbi:hypothetical protein NM208_g1463 [Fusarium decemcellulare]|uniref:Uncharacterized protein n=1 Tax=Fusarium decemcellulare TaxID=57161 RepID=A0ACC1SWA2_9HYPO|nr:hypothetical protein NM208_g1463 [Fusarium decemcellulare]
MPQDALNSRPPRKRAKHTRSKLGCGVCRIRRVRCDLTRPACQRCTKTGRKCDGYPTTESKGTPSPAQKRALVSSSSPALSGPLVLSPGTLTSLNVDGYRALDYFQTKAAPELCGFFESDLWSTLVLQISRREACVRQMIVALGFLHESFHTAHTTSNSPSSALSLRQKAIGEYGLGIGLLNKHISTQGWANLEITLLSSILCVTFEWLRGDYAAAHTHLWSSMSVMTQWTDGKRSLVNGTSLSSPGGYMIRTQIGPLWTSLVLQARTMPNDAFLSWRTPWMTEETSEPFSSLQQARKALDVLLGYLLPETISRKVDGTPCRKPWDLSRRLTEWSQNFSTYLATQGADQRESPRVTIMHLWHHTARVLFITSFSNDEIYYDAFLEEFTHIVTLAEELISSSTTQFSVDIGTVPLLYYVGLKCRHPQIRRRAVQVLQAVPRREAVWDSIGASRVVEEVIRVEEAGPGLVSDQYDIPSSARICGMKITTDVEHRRVYMRSLQQGSRSYSEQKVLTW